ncbi:MAG TPA: dTDP-4-dehydrorhamnose reductase [Candidatus Hydrogenedentes bacterium]|jgi:dTDP-4-dehydrorhamnose reductase|nr:dTDP-4-dehydrorhamnose reductase [Candidatus Hydrogenedentota bacterium]HPJ97841.1 dTDP-4-dehydrorhamnose reductase [Candidatus Hydrogenedentota bacterium]
MKVLVVGAKGQLGRELCLLFGADADVTGVDLPQLDITDHDSVETLVADTAPGIIINAAAYTDVEGAEDNRELAFAVNETGARIIAGAARRAGVPVVYYSTDYVFFGAQDDALEPSDPIMPRGVYAESKAAGEEATRNANPDHFIIRTAWLYGPGGNNFVEKILRAAATRPAVKVVQDEVGSPTHTFDVAEATRALCATTAYGTYHAVNSGQCSRFEFTREIFRLAGVGTPLCPCTADEFPMKAPRPSYSVLCTRKLTRACGYVMRPWQQALAHYFQRRKEAV